MSKTLFALAVPFMSATAAYADAAPAGGGQNPIAAFFPLIIFVVIFYFFILRPQRKRQKSHDNLVNSLQRGDRVITAGGFYAVVREVKEDSLIIDLAEGMPVRIAKSSVSTKVNPEAAKPAKKEAKAEAKAEKTEAPMAEDAPKPEETKVEEQK